MGGTRADVGVPCGHTCSCPRTRPPACDRAAACALCTPGTPAGVSSRHNPEFTSLECYQVRLRLASVKHHTTQPAQRATVLCDTACPDGIHHCSSPIAILCFCLACRPAGLCRLHGHDGPHGAPHASLRTARVGLTAGAPGTARMAHTEGRSPAGKARDVTQHPATRPNVSHARPATWPATCPRDPLVARHPCSWSTRACRWTWLRPFAALPWPSWSARRAGWSWKCPLRCGRGLGGFASEGESQVLARRVGAKERSEHPAQQYRHAQAQARYSVG